MRRTVTSADSLFSTGRTGGDTDRLLSSRRPGEARAVDIEEGPAGLSQTQDDHYGMSRTASRNFVIAVAVFFLSALLVTVVTTIIWADQNNAFAPRPSSSSSSAGSSSSSHPHSSSSSSHEELSSSSSSEHVSSSSSHPSSSSAPSSSSRPSSSSTPPSSSSHGSSSSGGSSSSAAPSSSSAAPPSSSSSSFHPSSSSAVSSSSPKPSSSSSSVRPSSSSVPPSSSSVPPSSSSSSGPFSSSSFPFSSSSSSASFSSSSAPHNPSCDESPCVNGGTCVVNGTSEYYCQCQINYSGFNCQFFGCANPNLNTSLVNQTDLDNWQQMVNFSSTFGFPNWLTATELLLDDAHEFLWMSSYSSSVLAVLDADLNQLIYVQPTAFANGIYRTAYSNDIDLANTVYVMATNCSLPRGPGPPLPCAAQFAIPLAQPLATLYLANFSFVDLNFINETYSVLTCNLDPVNAVWITLRDEDRGYPVYLSRWSQDLTTLYGSQDISNLGWIDGAHTVYLDEYNCRLFLLNSTDVVYAPLNCLPSPFVGNELVNSTQLVSLVHLPSFPLPDRCVAPINIASLDLSNGGNPYVSMRFLRDDGFVQVQTVHFSASDDSFLLNVPLFTYPLNVNATTISIYSYAQGDVYMTDGEHILVRRCTDGAPVCDPTCNLSVSTCPYNTCVCNDSPFFPYPACV